MITATPTFFVLYEPYKYAHHFLLKSFFKIFTFEKYLNFCSESSLHLFSTPWITKFKVREGRPLSKNKFVTIDIQISTLWLELSNVVHEIMLPFTLYFTTEGKLYHNHTKLLWQILLYSPCLIR